MILTFGTVSIFADVDSDFFFFVADAQIVSEIQRSMLMLKLYLLKRVLSAPPRYLCAPYLKRDEAHSKLY